MKTSVCRLGYAGLLITLLAAPVGALPQVESRTIQNASSLEERLNRIEQRLGGSLQAETLSQLSELQKEVQELRGLVESQEHEIQRLEKSSQKTSLDSEKSVSDGKTGKKKPDVVAEAPKPSETEAELPRASKTEQELFSSLQENLKQKQYTEAEKDAVEYLSYYPTGQFAANTHYFLGEIHWTEWHGDKSNTLLLEKAVHAFADVSNGFSEHAKAKDALLKLGLIETERGNWQSAAQYFKKVIERYPNTPSAKIAELRMHKLEQEGRVS